VREPTDEEFAAAGRAWDRMNAEGTEGVRVGTCVEHERLGIHVFGTFEDPIDGDEACADFKDIPNFAHECSENGNAFGGYNCTCGEPWLTNGCMTQPTPERLAELRRGDTAPNPEAGNA
jgi:hypothetical protein